MRLSYTLWFVAGLIPLLGCGGGGSVDKLPRTMVRGTVKVDGKPLETGHITFDSQSGQPPATMSILDGNFEGRAAVGNNKVMITSIKKVTGKELYGMDGPGYDEVQEVNAIPDRYNLKSEIEREVVEGESNEFNFDLKGK